MRVFLGAGCLVLGAALDNGLALTPGMGFNTWNQFGCNINETLIRAVADSMHKDGFVEAGYKHLVLDDFWMDKERDEAGRWRMDRQRFPSGPQALVEYLAAYGLELGLYSSAGPKTCQGRPASLGKERLDAETIVSWGVTFLKYDNCGSEGITEEEQAARHQAMRDALNATGKAIYYSLSEWNGHRGRPADWVRETANSWRTGGDIDPNWGAIMYQLDSFADFGEANLSAPGGWADPDMLEVGVIHTGDHPYSLSEDEARAHFALWCLLKAPLMMGANPVTMSDGARSILLNKHAIGINQDALGAPARKMSASDVHKVVTASCESAPRVTWQGSQLVRADTSLCLMANTEVLEPSTRNPSAQWRACDPDSSAQRWQNQSANAIVHVDSDLCLEVAWGHADPGAAVEVNTCGGWASEAWFMDSEAQRVVSGLNTGNCLGGAGSVSTRTAAASSSPDSEVWYAPLQSGDVAVVMLNRGEEVFSVQVDFESVGFLDQGELFVRDVWSQRSLGQHASAYQESLAPHSAAFVVLSASGAGEVFIV